jgi:hypothetical protein
MPSPLAAADYGIGPHGKCTGMLLNKKQLVLSLIQALRHPHGAAVATVDRSADSPALIGRMAPGVNGCSSIT